jgi:hypothetical protein
MIVGLCRDRLTLSILPETTVNRTKRPLMLTAMTVNAITATVYGKRTDMTKSDQKALNHLSITAVPRLTKDGF